MAKKFISSRTDLASHVGSAVCLFKDGELDSYCVFKTNYGGDYQNIDNSFDIRAGECYGAVCDVDESRIAYNNWIAAFF